MTKPMHPGVKILHVGTRLLEDKLKSDFGKAPRFILMIFDANLPALSTYITTIEDDFRIRLTMADAADLICEDHLIDRCVTTNNPDTKKYERTLLRPLAATVNVVRKLTYSDQWRAIMAARRTRSDPAQGVHPVRPALLALVPSQPHACGDQVGLWYRYRATATEAATALAVAAARCRTNPPRFIRLEP